MKLASPKDFVQKAKEEFSKIFEDRLQGSDILLEEVIPTDNGWRITLSFFEPKKDKAFYTNRLFDNLSKHYKVVELDKNGNVVKIENHQIDV